jgi:hypothetical protein
MEPPGTVVVRRRSRRVLNEARLSQADRQSDGRRDDGTQEI